MATRFIDQDEKFPFYTVSSRETKGLSNPVEMSDYDFGEYTRVMNEFYAWQSRLERLDSWNRRKVTL